MTLTESTDTPRSRQRSRQSALRQLSIPSKLTLAVVPLVTVTLLAGLFLVWTLVSGDTAEGFSLTDVLAIAIGLVVAVAAAGTMTASLVIGRSMSAAIADVSKAADTVANKDLIDLLDALRSSEPDLASIAPLEIDTDREDEIGDLARSFSALHTSLIEVAARQMEALRKGVSSIFVTLARRNSSLVDRQLALLDELEAREEDPKTLDGFYRIDHLATRMRRNAESLLVLAGSESPRIWARATDMADVVRAAVGEVDEYQRIEVLALEPAKLSGGAVSDVSHLLAELLENAIQFSPPSEAVRVTGLFDMDGYQLTVSDRGVGVSEARIAELNRILDKPPALGLSVEPTLGMYVVAKLAHRHGVEVELIKGVPGITARVTVPRDHLEISEKQEAKHWEVERAKKAPAGPEPHEMADAATREYVRNRQRSEEESAAEELIDLTSPAMTEPAGLPVRKPGQTFSDQDEPISTRPGESPIEIRSALSAYEQGRKAAEESGPGEERAEEAS
jgi:signal transduction histidine kinase